MENLILKVLRQCYSLVSEDLHVRLPVMCVLYDHVSINNQTIIRVIHTFLLAK